LNSGKIQFQQKEYKARIPFSIAKEPMDPTHAISVHLSWKLALRHAVASGVARNLDPEVLGRPDRCELGLWHESPLACAEGVSELGDAHRRFHLVAGDLIRLIRGGADPEVITRELAELEDLSARLGVMLGADVRA
jgi:hypothetical protein